MVKVPLGQGASGTLFLKLFLFISAFASLTSANFPKYPYYSVGKGKSLSASQDYSQDLGQDDADDGVDDTAGLGVAEGLDTPDSDGTKGGRTMFGFRCRGKRCKELPYAKGGLRQAVNDDNSDDDNLNVDQMGRNFLNDLGDLILRGIPHILRFLQKIFGGNIGNNPGPGFQPNPFNLPGSYGPNDHHHYGPGYGHYGAGGYGQPPFDDGDDDDDSETGRMFGGLTKLFRKIKGKFKPGPRPGKGPGPKPKPTPAPQATPGPRPSYSPQSGGQQSEPFNPLSVVSISYPPPTTATMTAPTAVPA